MIDYHYFFLIGSVLVAAVSQVLLKKGALHHYDSWIREYLNPWVITGYILMFGSVFLSIMGLRGVDFFNAPVIDSLGYVLVPVCGSDCFFHERSDCFFRQAFSRGAYCCALLFCRIPRPSRREILHRPSSTFSAREYVLRAAPFFSVLIRSFCLLSHGEPLFWHFPFFSSYAVPPLIPSWQLSCRKL